MNYFEFFGIETSFYVDHAYLKKRYHVNSRKYHPDFFAQESAEAKDEALEKTTLNNKAYTTLTDERSRIKYILELYDKISNDSEEKMDPEFLMEMMDINEAIMELQFDEDVNKLSEVKKEIDTANQKLDQEAEKWMQEFDTSKNTDLLDPIKGYFFKKKYLWRIMEKLDGGGVEM